MPIIVNSLAKLIHNSIEEGSLMELQQKQVFHLSLIILFLCIPVYIFTVPLPNIHFYYLSATVLAFSTIITLLYFSQHIKLNAAFSLILLAVEIETCIEMVYCSTLNDYPFQRLLIMSSVKLSVLFIMIPICAYMYKIALELAILTITSYMVCVAITNEPFLKSYLPLITLMFVMMPLLGRLLHKNIKKLQQKHDVLKLEEAQLLDSLQISKEELYTFAKLVNSSNKGEINNNLLDILGEKSKQNLYAAVAVQYKEEQSRVELIKSSFPELTKTELTICSLILQDKTVSQISEQLNRSAGNITSQRSKIRAKLGLNKEDNLKEVLKQRLLPAEPKTLPTTKRFHLAHFNLDNQHE